jgi:hypothetical protein
MFNGVVHFSRKALKEFQYCICFVYRCIMPFVINCHTALICGTAGSVINIEFPKIGAYVEC